MLPAAYRHSIDHVLDDYLFQKADSLEIQRKVRLLLIFAALNC